MNTKKPLVVITGVSAGIGKALANVFAENNYPLLLISRNIEPMQEFADKPVMYAQANVSDYKAMEKAIRKAEAKYGVVECLINNAGIVAIEKFRDAAIESCHQQVDVLLNGVINGIKVVLSDMSKRKSGTIINVSSIGDRKPFADAVTYHASKHAVRSIAESLQQAEAENNVRVINIAPGLVKTNIHAGMGMSFEEYAESFGNPVFLKSEEVAEVIYFCWKMPQHVCIRDLVVMPTSCAF